MTNINLNSYDHNLIKPTITIHKQLPHDVYFKTLKNILPPYIGAPNGTIKSYKEFEKQIFDTQLQQIISEYDTNNIDDVVYTNNYDKILDTYNKIISEHKKIIGITKHDKTKFIFNTSISSLLTCDEISNYSPTKKNHVYIHITYPTEFPCIMKFIPLKNKKDITIGELLYMYTIGYQLMYELEGTCNETIPGMCNRIKTNGIFGIWGHSINDLVYNGGSEIKIAPHHIYCNFECDS